jgi:hypothetical protein
MRHYRIFNGAPMAQISLRHYYWAPTHGVIVAQRFYYPHGNGAPVAQWRTRQRKTVFLSGHKTSLPLT